ncbi:BRO family protein [uncultured Actinobaculum sp.]|uniref:BRO-N domain-containing protein n=1 Tax=uncultured Actinobaculum sp. TaxID=655643 RepID=UPI0028061DB3|nr:BRO family protein [uncultured Actinobaculum sp.]
MNQVIPFTYEGTSVRTVTTEDGAPWFIAKDVCDILELTNTTVALEGLEEDERAKYYLGRQGSANVVNEAGLYSLIFKSRKPEAKAFKRWVTHEVLPQIRQHGYYAAEQRAHETNATIFQARARMELCQAARGLIHPDHLEAKARCILAQGLGEYPQLEDKNTPLYTQDFLKSKGVTGKQLKSIRGTFGKRVKAAYTLKHGKDPEQYALHLSNGQTRMCNGYTRKDRPLMEQVWDQYYAQEVSR